MHMNVSRRELQQVLNASELKFLSKLSTPPKIQDYLDSLPINFELSSETYMSPRRVMHEKTAHCFEGALLAALALMYHGERPLLMDLKTLPSDQDHVVALYRSEGRWGAISKTNHPILRYRDPVYRSVRELALSYFHEYILDDRRKSLRSYSAPFDLNRFKPEAWIAAEHELFDVVEALDQSRHFDIASQKILRGLRRADPIELKAQEIVEWPNPTTLQADS